MSKYQERIHESRVVGSYVVVCILMFLIVGGIGWFVMSEDKIVALRQIGTVFVIILLVLVYLMVLMHNTIAVKRRGREQ